MFSIRSSIFLIHPIISVVCPCSFSRKLPLGPLSLRVFPVNLRNFPLNFTFFIFRPIILRRRFFISNVLLSIISCIFRLIKVVDLFWIIVISLGLKPVCFLRIGKILCFSCKLFRRAALIIRTGIFSSMSTSCKGFSIRFLVLFHKMNHIYLKFLFISLHPRMFDDTFDRKPLFWVDLQNFGH